MKTRKKNLKKSIFFVALGFFLPLLAVNFKVTHEIHKVEMSVRTGAEVNPDTSIFGRVLVKQFRNIYNDRLYDLSVRLMGEDLRDNRPWYQTGTLGYMNERINRQPIYGDKTPQISCPIPIFIDCGVNQDDISYVNACINTMPENFISRMQKDGWVVRIREEGRISSGISKKHKDFQTIGQADFTDKIIYLDHMNLYGTVYHEFGHVLADYASNELDKAGLLDYTNEELAVLCNHTANGSLYIYLCPDEQLAESFFDYIYYPLEMQDQAPTLYKIYERECKIA